KLELLLRGEGNCAGDVDDVEIWNDANHTLLLFNLDLLFCHLDLVFCHFARRESDLHLSVLGRNRQRHPRDNVDLPWTQDSRRYLRFEALRRNGWLERSESNVGKGEL